MYLLKRKSGTGRKPEIMTQSLLNWLKKVMVAPNQPSVRTVARKLNCSFQHVSKTIKHKIKLKCKKKIKGPRFTDVKFAAVKRACRKLYTWSQGKDFVLDDEKFFTLSSSHMPANSYYYTEGHAPHAPLPHHVKTKAKSEPKLMLCIAISNAGISKPYIVPSGMAVRKEVYIPECLERRLLPFIRENHYTRLCFLARQS